MAGWLVGWRQKRAEKARRREATPLLRTHQLVGVTRLHTPHIYREFIGTRFFIVTPQKPPATVKKVNCRPFNMWVIKKVTNASLRHIGPQSGLFIKPHIKRSALYLLHYSGMFLRSDCDNNGVNEFPVLTSRGMDYGDVWMECWPDRPPKFSA